MGFTPRTGQPLQGMELEYKEHTVQKKAAVNRCRLIQHLKTVRS